MNSMRESPEDSLAMMRETRATGNAATDGSTGTATETAMEASTGMDSATERLVHDAEDAQDIPADCVSLWMRISTLWKQREEIKAHRAELRNLIAVITKELQELQEPADNVTAVYRIGMRTRLNTLHEGVRRSWRTQSEVEDRLLVTLYPWIRANLAEIRQARQSYRTQTRPATPVKGGDEHGENDDEEVAQGTD